MPSDSNGNYSLPSGYLATTGEPILASQHNPPLEDIAAGLTSRLLKTGATPMTGPFQITDGTAAAPGLTFAAATTTGLYRTASGTIGVSVGGVQVFEFTTAPQGRFVGEVVDYIWNAPPSGWVICQGQSLLRSTYPQLFALVGTYYGGDATHFLLPDLRCVVTAGYDPLAARGILSGASTIGALSGSETVALSQANLPSYTLPKTLGISDTTNYTVNGGTGLVNTSTGSQFGGGPVGATQNVTLTKTGSVTLTGDTQSGGSGTPHANVQPTIIMNKIVFTGVV